MLFPTRPTRTLIGTSAFAPLSHASTIRNASILLRDRAANRAVNHRVCIRRRKPHVAKHPERVSLTKILNILFCLKGKFLCEVCYQPSHPNRDSLKIFSRFVYWLKMRNTVPICHIVVLQAKKGGWGCVEDGKRSPAIDVSSIFPLEIDLIRQSYWLSTTK